MFWRDNTSRTLVTRKAWKRLRDGVLERDNWICQYCGIQVAFGLQAHHLNGNPEDNRQQNLCAICTACHLIVHSGFGSEVVEVVDLYRYADYSQVEVVRRTIKMRGDGLDDESIIERLGLMNRARFKMNRDYLRPLIGFITERPPQVANVEHGLQMLYKAVREDRSEIRERWLQERRALLQARRTRTLLPRTTIPFRAIGLLRSTFCHIRGIGRSWERRLWESGVRTWDDLIASPSRAGFLGKVASAAAQELRQHDEATAEGKWDAFTRLIENGNTWRFYSALHANALYLDIETTGLVRGLHDITVVGTFDGREFRFFTKGENLDELPDYVANFGLLVTFNGNSFDLPFIETAFPAIRLGQPRWDVRGTLAQLGYKGPLKVIEQNLSVARPADIRSVEGFDAPLLWNAHEKGDKDALRILQRYCGEDVASLPVLAAIAFNLQVERLGNGFEKIPILTRPVVRIPFDREAIKRVLPYKFSDVGLEAMILHKVDVRLGDPSLLPSRERKLYWIAAPSSRWRGRITDPGKWLIFVPADRIDQAWAVICENVNSGGLGLHSMGAKVSTARPNPQSRDLGMHVICVYTPDANDVQGVLRVRQILREIGITQKIPYKTDRATYQRHYSVDGYKGIATYLV